jgi:hypothetical protein
VAPGKSNHIVVATVSDPILSNGVNTGGILVSQQGGASQSWQKASGTPTAMCTSVTFHPFSADTLLATFGGYGHPHLYRSVDGGLSWTPWGAGLPDLPANTVIYDPSDPQHVYLGNDLSVWYSADGGVSWEWWGDGLPEACLVMDLSISRPAHELWVATHGNGVYAASLQSDPVSVQKPVRPDARHRLDLWPNPARDVVHLRVEATLPSLPYQVEVWTLDGRQQASFKLPLDALHTSLHVNAWKIGVYVLVLRDAQGNIAGAERLVIK